MIFSIGRVQALTDISQTGELYKGPVVRWAANAPLWQAPAAPSQGYS